jgi:two-component system cell cycle response regulator
MFTILHIDNKLFYKEILKELSLTNDFSYFSVPNLEKAIKILNSHEIHLIITGLEFKHNEKGQDFIKELKNSNYENIPIIVLTASDNQILKESLLNIGVVDFINKDNFVEKLLVHINELTISDYISQQLQSISIAVLDDDTTQLSIIENIFKFHNINHVDYYTNSHDLLNSNKEYGIYLIDYVLPDISGDEVIQIIRENNKYSVIIAVSAIGTHETISKLLSIGADDYITKPYSINVFLARIKTNVRTYCLMKDLKEKNEKLESLIKIDSLTSLLNHKNIIDQLEHEMLRIKRHKASPLSIIMLDIDKFKLINDIYGHQCGDGVLIELSNFLQNTLTEIDYVGRYGGEEFLIILPDSNLFNACIIGDKLRQDIEKIPFSKDKITITISAGIAELKNDTAHELIKKADSLLYKAKNNGRNRIEC